MFVTFTCYSVLTKIMNLKILKGKKIYLRPPKNEDCLEFTELNKQSRKFHKNLANPPKDKKSFAEYVAKNELSANECFLICTKENKAIAGAINLSQIFYGNFMNAYLGYFVGEKFAGKDFATAAISLILKFAFRDLKLHRIEANVQPHNFSSIAVLKKNNFTKEGFSRKYLKIGGRWLDHARWAIIKDDWREKWDN